MMALLLTRRAAAAATAAAILSRRDAMAQDYPSRVVTIIVPYPPGGQPDVMARFLADRLNRAHPGRFVVENRVGGAGNIGTSYVARAQPDGSTIMVGTVASHGVNPGLFGANLPYDPVADFRHIALLATAPGVLVVHPSFPARSFQEFVAIVRVNPGRFSYASPGPGTLNRLVMEMTKRKLGLDIVGVPYRGAGPAFNDTVAGHVQANVTNIELAAQAIAEGRLRGLAVGAHQRAALLPDVPTLAELGHPDLVSPVWSGLFAPVRTPDAIVAWLAENTRMVLQDPELRSAMAAVGAVPGEMTPAQFEAFVRSEVARLTAAVREIGMTADN